MFLSVLVHKPTTFTNATKKKLKETAHQQATAKNTQQTRKYICLKTHLNYQHARKALSPVTPTSRNLI
jgi:hypothetical protein